MNVGYWVRWYDRSEHCDDFDEFETRDQVVAFVEDKLRRRGHGPPQEVGDFTVIQGRQLALTAIEVVASVELERE